MEGMWKMHKQDCVENLGLEAWKSFRLDCTATIFMRIRQGGESRVVASINSFIFMYM